MKRKLVERVFDIQTPQDAIGSKKESTLLKVPEDAKEKKRRKISKTLDLIKPTPPLTRSSTRKITSD